jgi:hypothetical protein
MPNGLGDCLGTKRHRCERRCSLVCKNGWDGAFTIRRSVLVPSFCPHGSPEAVQLSGSVPRFRGYGGSCLSNAQDGSVQPFMSRPEADRVCGERKQSPK